MDKPVRSAALLLLLAAASIMMVQAKVYPADVRGRLLIAEVGEAAYDHTTTYCNPNVTGSIAACYDSNIPVANNYDFKWGEEEISYPTNGAPWGFHITPSARAAYIISWVSGDSKVGPAETLSPGDTSAMTAKVSVSSKRGAASKGGKMCKHECDVGSKAVVYTGEVITYTRAYTTASFANYSYLSPYLSHVVVHGLKPNTRYYYSVANGRSKWSQEISFRTLPAQSRSAKRPSHTYPLRVGLMADIGQTINSSITRDHLMANDPQLIIFAADFSYADHYAATGPDTVGSGTNQKRWDSFTRLWEPLLKRMPFLPSYGNHEIESNGIAAVINYTTTSFSYPTNYPFQSSSARYPVPGISKDFGTIDKNLYYATTVGPVRVIALNNYIPFHQGTPQYEWAMDEFKKVDRSATPWLIVTFHAPPYHTYLTHYKEMDCFMSIWEDVFYQYGVDLIINGHVHAYERTHPVYKYQSNTCGPMYITIGDGGNVEGPYRNFVDEIDPKTNKTYCEGLTNSGQTLNQLWTSNPSGWGPSYQRQAHPPNCPTITWQPANGVKGGAPALLLNTTENLASPNPVGFCQTSQPEWSAWRDPSFGHGILTLLSDTTARFQWFRNIDGEKEVRDSVLLERQTLCANKK